MLPDVQLQPHQQRVRDEALQAAQSGTPYRTLLGWNVGSGKSLGSLSIADALGQPAAIIGPAALRQTLRNESNKFLGHNNYPVYSYNQAAAGKVPETPTLIVDEAQRLGSPSSRQSQAVQQLAAKAKNVVLMSGTPIRNSPAELAPILSILTKERVTNDDFNKRYVGTATHRRNLIEWIRGLPKEKTPALVNVDELKDKLQGHVDYHKPDKTPVDVSTEEYHVEMTPQQAQIYKAFWGRVPLITSLKLKWNYDLTPAEFRKSLAFVSGPRQVANSDFPYHVSGDPYRAYLNSGKLTKAFSLLQDALKDERKKAIIYSNHVQAGLMPYAAKLRREGIPHAVFDGSLSDQERKQLVDDFNANKIRVALLAPAASEGISLKGAQTVQILDPYWSESRTAQAAARGIRYDSHKHLPPELQHVTVQKFYSKLPLSASDRLLQSIGINREHKRDTVDDYLVRLANKKEQLNTQLMDVLKEVGTKKSCEALTTTDLEIIAAITKQAQENRRYLSHADDLIINELVKYARGVADPTVLPQLRQAKLESDNYNYAKKTEILRNLISQNPNDWVIDSDQGYTVGITHRSGFRFHIPKHNIMDLLQQSPAAVINN